MQGLTVRRLGVEEAAAFRAIRLEALANAPAAFGSTHDVEAARPLADFAARLSQAAVFGAFDEGALLGMAGFYAMDGAKERHKGVLWGMYVRPPARGGGAAVALVQAVIGHAGGPAGAPVEQVLLTVAAGNEPARRLYAGQGFVQYGVEPRALRQDDAYVDEILMVRFVASPGGERVSPAPPAPPPPT